MKFASFAQFIAMGHHGPFVWSAYAIGTVVVIWNVAAPWLARRRYLQQEARRLRRERQA
ncbi:heme exporter protein CcmD [Pseudomonas typographi]|uniref:Heme exporter protein D n=1 Tax=Pseudomonas typographi TaxID=2715964 RepID=A0ABR7Z8Q3_9PSED|nr:heme exporter protein CcmD [Pseudomonas typographi]MBD1554201.1 heme exporter protein CcmD [Pseudomonas typographi]MBD1586693.1 heme exporter protein CcmD [Pseudomonas typographi]MBD1601689.1 heme exporter protein CcmD [Pseudomonas typographi]